LAQRRKKSAKKIERWNDPPRRGNPFGLILIAAGASGLLYAACAPKVKHAAVSLPPAQNAAPVIPRAHYEPPRGERTARAAAPPVRVEETEASSNHEPVIPRRKRHQGAVAALPEPENAPEPTVIVEPPVDLAPAPDAPAKPKPARRRPALETPAPPKPAIRPVTPPSRAGRPSIAEFARNPGASGEVALTFDGCYDDKPLPAILSALEHRGYHATFFIAGVFADRYPTSVRRISDAGMEIGNHSWSHPAFTKLSDAEITRQLTRTNDLIEKITGQKPNLFRPPFGARDTRVRTVLSNEGFRTVYWALDSWDSVKKGITPKEITDRVLGRVQPGDVVLLHIGSRATADALPGILQGLDARGLRVVPVSQLMG
jgi:peptidoglycan/xylan/chitin deacetylase (PgdA/CDA1 family)